jgi:NAD(P)-dependent dehydrogenase (short-subunit alcohol dehydrogenase family)
MTPKDAVESNLTVLITGASTGIGEACAHFLDQKGFRVFAGFRKQSDGERLAGEGSDRLFPLRLDVTDSDSIAEAEREVRKATSGCGLNGLVNNAGIVVGGPLELVPIERLRMQLEVNLIGQVAVTQAMAPLLREATGRIVNMSSISGRIASPMIGPYAISKFGLEAFSDSLRRELYPWGIHVSSVEPGAISTPIWNKSIDRVDDVLETMDPSARVLYGDSIEEARQAAVRMSENAVSAAEVAKVVHHALTASRPKTRYLVGKDAKVIARLAWLLPDRAMDWLMRRSRS